MRDFSRMVFFAVAALAAMAARAAAQSVVKYGADPSGRTESTAAFQACIDAVANAGGGSVRVPPGEYRIRYLTMRPHVRLELAGGAGIATAGWTPAVAANAMNPKLSAIIRSVEGRTDPCRIFLYNLVPPADARKGFSDITVSGGVFDCGGYSKLAAFACGRNIRIENVIVKDLPNDHAIQLDGCENATVRNCIFAGYTFGGKHRALTRETIQVEQTSPGAMLARDRANSPITCPKSVAIPNANVTVSGCWFGPSERLGPHLTALGHHASARSCNGLAFRRNVVVEPLYCALSLANVADATVEGNLFISTKAPSLGPGDAAIVRVWGKAALGDGEKGVTIRRNKVTLGPDSPLRRLWISEERRGEVTVWPGDGLREPPGR